MKFDESGLKKVLTFFAHPDDETLAAGATLKKLTEKGVEVFVAIPATGILSRRNEFDKKELQQLLVDLKTDCVKALSHLGIREENIFLGNFRDNEIDKHSLLELVHWFEDIIKKINPDVIFTHHRFCTNIDHQYCHEAAVVATRPSVNSHITLISAEVPSSTGYLRPAQWEPNYYSEISELDLNSKILSMESFKEEARKDPHPRSEEVLRALAKVRGSESGFYLAESFTILKSYS